MWRKRSTQPELMDDLTLATDALRQNLKELEIINEYLGGHDVVRKGLDRILAHPFSASFSGKTLKIADLGSGGGDTLRMVAKWARKRNLPVELIGLDANAFMVDYGTRHSHQYPEIRFEQVDVFSQAFTVQKYDIVICSLFLHHFTDEALVQLFSGLQKQVNVAVLINDLHRHPLAFYSIKALTAAFSQSHLVRHDAPLSVERAFIKEDWHRLLSLAGVPQFELRWRWAFRWQVVFGPFLGKQPKNE